jgi:hypothetical protein
VHTRECHGRQDCASPSDHGWDRHELTTLGMLLLLFGLRCFLYHRARRRQQREFSRSVVESFVRQLTLIGDGRTPSWRVSGAGSAQANGIFRPGHLPSDVGAQPYSNGDVTLFRWRRQRWVLSDLGPAGSNFHESRWLYAAPTDWVRPDLPPTLGWAPW